MVTMNSEADKTQATNALATMSSAVKSPAESTNPSPTATPITTSLGMPPSLSSPPPPSAGTAAATSGSPSSLPVIANGNNNGPLDNSTTQNAVNLNANSECSTTGNTANGPSGSVTKAAAATATSSPPTVKTERVRESATTTAATSDSSSSALKSSSGLLTMEAIIEKMQAESTGVAVRTVKAFMSKVPSVFTGADLIAWIVKNFDVEDVTEALHFAHLLSSHGYIFPIDDHALTVKNDGTFYRFQTPYFWPSNCWEPENTDYAVYLCKRTMQNKTRLELADYEAENLAKLQKMFSRKWEFIFMQAESQSKVAKKRDKLERKVLDSQERAFWDVHRPMPGCVNTTEIDIKKAYRRGGSSHGTGSAGASVAKNPVEQLTRIIALRKQKLERRTIKVSKAAEALVAYYDQYNEFDYFITSPELPNPWQTDSTEMWDTEKNSKEVPVRRVKRWAFSLRELLNDAIGREQFTKFLEKEYSGENLKFWESVQDMKALPQSEIKETIQQIWQEFLAPDAPCPVNVDSKSVELAREAVNSPNGPNRWCFDVAASHVYHLMKSDSYSRYLRSDMYKDYLNCSRKKIKSIPNLFGVKR
ncbi:uncharacterized protein Dwil_GK25823 [Drosophila willistoni]|uniref:Regulator of G-protein signaling 7 n=1 Tax=Drosophila willistoni TaxID=7260 RepID=B4NCA6_DROWI|nr:uncharacterized protein Dwil_GK25823 [Drosophila willistoni]